MEIEDVIIKADTLGANGLIFPKDVIIEAVRNYRDRPDLKVGKITSKKNEFQLHEVTHKIKWVDFFEEENSAKAMIELLDTAASKVIYNDPYAYFLNPVLSIDIVEQEDGSAIVKGLEIIRVDVIHKPEFKTNSFIKEDST
jgi:hypothetical protein